MEDDQLAAPEPPSMAWLLTFADLVSLLITFFVLLFSMKTVDSKTWEALVGELVGIFAVEQAVISARPEVDFTVERVETVEADHLSYIENLLLTRFGADPVLSQVRTLRDYEHNLLKITLPSHLLFPSGASGLNEAGTLAVATLADILRHLDNRVEVAGHTDPVPIYTSAYPTNWELAMVRALAVAEVFESRGAGMSIPAISYGPSRIDEIPPELGLLERNAQARRVEVIVHGIE